VARSPSHEYASWAASSASVPLAFASARAESEGILHPLALAQIADESGRRRKEKVAEEVAEFMRKTKNVFCLGVNNFLAENRKKFFAATCPPHSLT
jgi:hypothetical protein